MDPLNLNNAEPLIEEKVSTETPEDVAVLYNWANLQGAQYRDFSASRREYRAQMHRRAAEERRKNSAQRMAAAQVREDTYIAQHAESEKEELERAFAEKAEHIHRERADKLDSKTGALESLETQLEPKTTQDSFKTEEPFRLPAYQPLPTFSARDSREQYESKHYKYAVVSDTERLPENKSSLSWTPSLHSESDNVRQEVLISKVDPVHNNIESPYFADTQDISSAVNQSASSQMSYESQRGYIGPQKTDNNKQKVERSLQEIKMNADGYQASAYDNSTFGPDQKFSSKSGTISDYSPKLKSPTSDLAKQEVEQRDVKPLPNVHTYSLNPVPNKPEWLYSTSYPSSNSSVSQGMNLPASPISDTLQYSRERVASRWFALKGIFDPPAPEPESPKVIRHTDAHPPVLAVFSLAGGVGKTSLVATLGRTLSALGEKTLLLDTTAYGLLPFYFGARELRPNTMRTFAPPSGSTDAAIHMISINTDSKPHDSNASDPLIEDIQRSARGTNRIVVDVTTAAAPLVRRILKLSPIVLVPIAPDMNSVISLNAVEQFFNNQQDAEERLVKVYYLLNQFDPSQPLHLDVREVLRQQLGERLLPFVVRRSPAVSEALAEGMTVMDYAPNSPTAEDFVNLANWLRNISVPVTAAFRGIRWSEQS